MPTYKFHNKENGDEFTEFMSISEMEKFLEENPHIEQLVNGAPGIGDPFYRQKPSQDFRDRLKEMKKAHPLGNIQTW